MDKQEAFLFYRSFYEATKNLPAELYKEIMMAIMEYALNGEEVDLSPMAECAFLLVKPQIDANNRKRENGRKGGSANGKGDADETKQEANSKQTEANPKQSEANSKQTEANESKPEAKVKSIKDKDKSKSISKPLMYSAAEPVADAPAQAEADCESIPLNDGSEWRPTQEQFEEYERLYPGVDVKQAFRAMRGWCLSNPTRRKTRRGVSAFVTSWMNREQNRAPARADPPKKTRFDNFESHGTDYDALMWGMVTGGKA